MYVIKRSGEREPFDPEKTRLAIMRSGLSVDEADVVLERLQGQLYDGISTEEIYRRVRTLLASNTKVRYGLKKAIMNLGPEGHYFETFVGALFKDMGFKVKVREIAQGRCVQHELDVLADNGKLRYMVECKFHNSLGIKCSIQTALYTYGRFLDLQTELGLEAPWLVTNTRFSSEVVRYGECVCMGLLGWRFPEDEGLETLVERFRLYPVTILDLRRGDMRTLLENDIILVKDILQRQESVCSLLSKQSADQLVAQAELLMG
jgi:hypothetical protein